MTDHPATRITCAEAIAFLGDYVDGAIPPDVSRHLLEHLGVCPPCLQYLETYQATPRVARAALSKEMPEEMKERLKAFLAGKLRR